MPLKAASRYLLASGVLSLPIIGGDLARDDRKFFQYAKNVLEERVAAEENTKQAGAQKDIMHHLLHAEDPMTGEAFSHDQLSIESSLLIAAGADTTSLTLAAAFFYLLHNPHAMHTLVEEIRSTFNSSGSEDLMAPSKLVGLPYLRAVVDETLRLSPPVPSLLPREVLKGGITIDGSFIPEGTIVGVPAYAIHRNPEYYPEPDNFCPERWLVTHSDAAASDNTLSSPFLSRSHTRSSVSLARQAFIAFSQGSRGCIGRQLAYYELHTALAHLLHRFDVHLARDLYTQELMRDSTDWRSGCVDVVNPTEVKENRPAGEKHSRKVEQFQLFDRFLADRNGPMVEFKERKIYC
jgi:cytochrome P450